MATSCFEFCIESDAMHYARCTCTTFYAYFNGVWVLKKCEYSENVSIAMIGVEVGRGGDWLFQVVLRLALHLDALRTAYFYYDCVAGKICICMISKDIYLYDFQRNVWIYICGYLYVDIYMCVYICISKKTRLLFFSQSDLFSSPDSPTLTHCPHGTHRGQSMSAAV